MHAPRLWIRWLSLAAFLGTEVLLGAPRFLRDEAAIDRVIELIDRRLALMPEVAAVKYRENKPIADPPREREVLAQSVADAQGLNLDRDAARGFFSIQIGMARAVQNHWFEQWRAPGAPPPAARDLVRELRPQLDAIGREMLSAVYLATTGLSEIPTAELRQRVARLRRHAGVTEALLAELAQSLGAIRITGDLSWAALERVGVLRIGTTGDYAPFSSDQGGELRGLDVQLGEELAKSWGVTAVFVRTTWPSLMADLDKRRFDLAAAGISITLERSKRADFSTPYFFDGKTPIARRENAERFSSLEKIDQQGVRVIVNPGGTNERFVREHIKRATIVVHPDNRSIFDEIVARRADVMITDGVEVRLQARKHPELQATMAAPFTRTGKAILLPRDSELTARVDVWLAPQVARGVVAERMEQELATARK